MRKAIFLYIAVYAVALLTGCGGGQMPKELQAVNGIIDDHPDSALVLLEGMDANKSNWNKAARMQYDLLKMKAQNKAYVDFTSDSTAKVLVDYYSRHGNRQRKDYQQE